MCCCTALHNSFMEFLKYPSLVLYSLSYTPLLSVLSYLIQQQTITSMLLILNFVISSGFLIKLRQHHQHNQMTALASVCYSNPLTINHHQSLLAYYYWLIGHIEFNIWIILALKLFKYSTLHGCRPVTLKIIRHKYCQTLSLFPNNETLPYLKVWFCDSINLKCI